MRNNKILSDYYLIKIHKNIPVFAGFVEALVCCYNFKLSYK